MQGDYMKEKIMVVLRKFPHLKRFASAFRQSLKNGRLKQILHYCLAGHFVRAYKINRALNKQACFLQIGGGRHVIDNCHWLNADIIYGDVYINAARRLPFSDNSVDLIFTEHFIEHLDQKAAQKFVKEAYRILKPNGVLRQSTPSMEKLISLYLDKNPMVSLHTALEKHITTHRPNDDWVEQNGCQLLNDSFRLWGHQFIYDEQTLLSLHQMAGFTESKVFKYGVSFIADLRNKERHARHYEWKKDGLSLIVESQKS